MKKLFSVILIMGLASLSIVNAMDELAERAGQSAEYQEQLETALMAQKMRNDPEYRAATLTATENLLRQMQQGRYSSPWHPNTIFLRRALNTNLIRPEDLRLLSGTHPLSHAALHGDPETFNAILRVSDQNAKNDALIHVSKHGQDPETARTLLEAGANPHDPFIDEILNHHAIRATADPVRLQQLQSTINEYRQRAAAQAPR